MERYHKPAAPAALPADDALPPVGMESSISFARRWALAACGLDPGAREVGVVCRRQGWGFLQRDRSIVGLPIRVAGKAFEHGLGTHADSEILLTARQPIKVLRAWVGMDDNVECRAHNRGSPARLVFSVTAGGRELWRSAALGIDSGPVRVEVGTGDASEVILNVREVSGNLGYAHADWAGLEAELADGTRVVIAGGPFAAQSLPLGGPFSFLMGGRPSADLLPGWPVKRESTRASYGTDVRTAWTDAATGLQCILELRTFDRFPAVEWLLRLRNTGGGDTPLIERIRPLDAAWSVQGDVALRRSIGSPCTIADFQCRTDPLAPGEAIAMTAGGGRSSNAWLPFFNLQAGAEGVVAGIGWSGQWAAEFAREADSLVRLRAGQELTRLVLHPDEEIRTPRILLLFWHGDPQNGHNALRRFMLAFHTPRPGGMLLRAPLSVAHWGGMQSGEHLARIETYRRHGLEYEYYWMDAGWYGPPDSYSPDEFTGDWYKHVGNWTINPAAHPGGLRPVSDAAAAAGMKFLLWFEPERAVCGTPLTVEHPDWFLGERKPGASLLFKLGDPAARRWLTDFISGFLTEQGIGLYRQDFNFDPLPYWRGADAPDRQGISEIRHIEGLYAFWDELLRRHPGLVIDNCASGGRRIDLETLSRSIPLWRSDWQCRPDNDPIGGQTHQLGLSWWVPLHGTGTWGSTVKTGEGDTYRVRSAYGAAFQFSLFPYVYTPVREDYPWEWHRARLAEYRRARPLFYGDYYPLTPCTAAADAWAVAQFDRPDAGQGMVMAFRRRDCPFVTADFRLRGLDAAAEYRLEDADSGRQWTQSGRELLERGLRLTMETAPESRLVFYSLVRGGD